MSLKRGISVLIHTFNEEKNIRNCLESVKWADEIVVVDMYSEDKTIEIAKEYTDKVYFFERKGYADPARQYGVERCSFNWVLVVDADEMIPKKLYLRLKDIVEKDEADVVYIPRKNYMFGFLLKGTGWGISQSMIPRFFKKGFLRLGDKVHDVVEKVNPDARLLYLTAPEMAVIHFNYIDIEHFLDKGINKYTSIEAMNMLTGKKPVMDASSLLFEMAKEVMVRMLSQKGYKDGLIGLYLSIMMAVYRLNSFAKLRLMERHNTLDPEDKIQDIYLKIAEKILEEYEESD